MFLYKHFYYRANGCCTLGGGDGGGGGFGLTCGSAIVGESYEYCSDVGEVWVGAWGKFGCAAK